MTDLVVVTALLGTGPDKLGPPPPVVDGVRYVCVTDRPDALPAGWQRHPYTGPPGPSRLQARWVRAHVTSLFNGTPCSLWLDASFDLLVSPRLFAEELERRDVDMVAFRHPDRQRMSAEAAEIVRLGQVSAQHAQEIVDTYRAWGWDTDENPQTALTAGGVLVRRHTACTAVFGLRWWVEMAAWGERADQLTLDYCAAQVGLTIGHLEGHYAKHPWLRYDWARHKGLAVSR